MSHPLYLSIASLDAPKLPPLPSLSSLTSSPTPAITLLLHFNDTTISLAHDPSTSSSSFCTIPTTALSLDSDNEESFSISCCIGRGHTTPPASPLPLPSLPPLPPSPTRIPTTTMKTRAGRVQTRRSSLLNSTTLAASHAPPKHSHRKFSVFDMMMLAAVTNPNKETGLELTPQSPNFYAAVYRLLNPGCGATIPTPQISSYFTQPSPATPLPPLQMPRAKDAIVTHRSEHTPLYFRIGEITNINLSTIHDLLTDNSDNADDGSSSSYTRWYSGGDVCVQLTFELTPPAAPTPPPTATQAPKPVPAPVQPTSNTPTRHPLVSSLTLLTPPPPLPPFPRGHTTGFLPQKLPNAVVGTWCGKTGREVEKLEWFTSESQVYVSDWVNKAESEGASD